MKPVLYMQIWFPAAAIGGPQVGVDGPFLVRLLERLGNPLRDGERLIEGNRRV